MDLLNSDTSDFKKFFEKYLKHFLKNTWNIFYQL